MLIDVCDYSLRNFGIFLDLSDYTLRNFGIFADVCNIEKLAIIT